MTSLVIRERKYYLTTTNRGPEGLSSENMVLIHPGECYIGTPLSNIDWTCTAGII
jgi:hypothetical protein